MRGLNRTKSKRIRVLKDPVYRAISNPYPVKTLFREDAPGASELQHSFVC
jgi:hypothetical protein